MKKEDVFKVLIKSRINTYIANTLFNKELILFEIKNVEKLTYKQIALAVDEIINEFYSGYKIEISEFDKIVQTVCLITITQQTNE